MANFLIGVTGSVAAIKVHKLCQLIIQRYSECNIRIVATARGSFFLKRWEAIENVELIKDEEEEWKRWEQVGDKIYHIDLRNWASILIICPLDANTLAKLANGLCDNLLTCIARAWNFDKPFLCMPAMNSSMWYHPLTEKHLTILKSFGIKSMDPIEKQLACGEKGIGGLPDVEDILRFIHIFV